MRDWLPGGDANGENRGPVATVAHPVKPAATRARIRKWRIFVLLGRHVLTIENRHGRAESTGKIKAYGQNAGFPYYHGDVADNRPARSASSAGARWFRFRPACYLSAGKRVERWPRNRYLVDKT